MRLLLAITALLLRATQGAQIGQFTFCDVNCQTWFRNGQFCMCNLANPGTGNCFGLNDPNNNDNFCLVFRQGQAPALGTYLPTVKPTTGPPTWAPTDMPSTMPTPSPTKVPTMDPTNPPSAPPTMSPTRKPSPSPTPMPTRLPTSGPTRSPSEPPTSMPTTGPTPAPTNLPTTVPTRSPTDPPSTMPTSSPTRSPTRKPTPQSIPTMAPTNWSICFGMNKKNCKKAGKQGLCNYAKVKKNDTYGQYTNNTKKTKKLCLPMSCSAEKKQKKCNKSKSCIWFGTSKKNGTCMTRGVVAPTPKPTFAPATCADAGAPGTLGKPACNAHAKNFGLSCKFNKNTKACEDA